MKKLLGFEIFAVLFVVGTRFWMLDIYKTSELAFLNVLFGTAVISVISVFSAVAFIAALGAAIVLFLFSFSAEHVAFAFPIPMILFLALLWISSIYIAGKIQLKEGWILGSLATEAVIIFISAFLTPWAVLGVVALPFFLLAPLERQVQELAV